MLQSNRNWKTSRGPWRAWWLPDFLDRAMMPLDDRLVYTFFSNLCLPQFVTPDSNCFVKHWAWLDMWCYRSCSTGCALYFLLISLGTMVIDLCSSMRPYWALSLRGHWANQANPSQGCTIGATCKQSPSCQQVFGKAISQGKPQQLAKKSTRLAAKLPLMLDGRNCFSTLGVWISGIDGREHQFGLFPYAGC